MSDRDEENENEVKNFRPGSAEEREMLWKIKISFPCWRIEAVRTRTARQRMLKVGKLGAQVVGLFLLVSLIGPLVGQGETIGRRFKANWDADILNMKSNKE